jgi:hypothetical protein
MSSNYTPAIRLGAPDTSISERPGKGLTLECPAHFHTHAHYGDVSKALDAFLAWLETRDAHETTPVSVQIILFSIDCAVWASEDKRVVYEAIEFSHIAGELRLAKR